MPKDSTSNINDVIQQLASELGDQPISFETSDGRVMVMMSQGRYDQLVRCEQELLYDGKAEGGAALEESPLILELNSMKNDQGEETP